MGQPLEDGQSRPGQQSTPQEDGLTFVGGDPTVSDPFTVKLNRRGLLGATVGGGLAFAIDQLLSGQTLRTQIGTLKATAATLTHELHITQETVKATAIRESSIVSDFFNSAGINTLSAWKTLVPTAGYDFGDYNAVFTDLYIQLLPGQTNGDPTLLNKLIATKQTEIVVPTSSQQVKGSGISRLDTFTNFLTYFRENAKARGLDQTDTRLYLLAYMGSQIILNGADELTDPRTQVLANLDSIMYSALSTAAVLLSDDGDPSQSEAIAQVNTLLLEKLDKQMTAFGSALNVSPAGSQGWAEATLSQALRIIAGEVPSPTGPIIFPSN